MEKTLFPKFPGYQEKKMGLWDVLAMREAGWAYTSQRSIHGKAGQLLESPDFGSQLRMRRRAIKMAEDHVVLDATPLHSSQFFRSYQSHEVLEPHHSSRLKCTSREGKPGICRSYRANYGFHCLILSESISELGWGPQITSGYVWVHLDMLSSWLNCEQFQSKILIKVVSVG